MKNAVDTAIAGLESGEITEQDVLDSPSLLDRLMYTRDCPPLELLIRTSGEIRLSDFLLYQAGPFYIMLF